MGKGRNLTERRRAFDTWVKNYKAGESGVYPQQLAKALGKSYYQKWKTITGKTGGGITKTRDKSKRVRCTTDKGKAGTKRRTTRRYRTYGKVRKEYLKHYPCYPKKRKSPKKKSA